MLILQVEDVEDDFSDEDGSDDNDSGSQNDGRDIIEVEVPPRPA